MPTPTRFTRTRLVTALVLLLHGHALAEPLRVATFDIDATPPVGSPLAYDVMERIDKPLHCRGIVILSDQAPIALIALDWIGIANGGNEAFRSAIADALDTIPERVAVHTLHQHDAPTCDFTADALLAPHRLSGIMFNTDHARDVIARAAAAAAEVKGRAIAVTHAGAAEAIVHDIASNRRILGPDGKVRVTRWTATPDPELRAMPEGTIDPTLRLLAFFNGDRPLAVLTFYATHPQSYYRTRAASPDFPGLARDARDDAIGRPINIHFNGAGGNIGAGKFNDGSPENRPVLAARLADGMARAYDDAAAARRPVTGDDLHWAVEPVRLPPAAALDPDALRATVADDAAPTSARTSAAETLAFLDRTASGRRFDIARLTVADTHVVFLPGEPVVEIQLAAAAMRPDDIVAVAGYGDYATGYICLPHHYWQGGYEDSRPASRVSPRASLVLLDAISRLLRD